MDKRIDFNEMEHDACGIGAVCNIDGHQDNRVLDDALSIVEKLEHRAGKDATGEVGDGVGILTQISHDYFKEITKPLNIELKDAGDYGVGMFFMPVDSLKRTLMMRMFEVIVKKNNAKFLGWRNVPTHPEILGKAARDCKPFIIQGFVERPENVKKGKDFDRLLYVIRREFEQGSSDTYVNSLSSRTIVYKGMFLVKQLRQFYEDLNNKDYKTSIAIVHSRFSTNTTPSWQRAHPYRLIAHNGEINTIKGNVDRMLAREETMTSKLLEEDLDKIYPVVNSSGSDSAMLDNTLEFLYMNGMDLPLALMTMIPEPFRYDYAMDETKKDFYHYYATMMEPWDGPAAIIYSDGEILGASLDRNGLRPSRYYITKDNRLILSSEVGVLDIDPSMIVKKERLEPGKMLLVDTNQKRIITDEECKTYYSKAHPFGEWLNMNLLKIEDLKIPNKKIANFNQETRDKLYKVFGYTYEDVKEVLLPMAKNGLEATASMGHDIPLAVLSDKHQPLFNYFKQLFAQVTNPPIDSIREEIVTDTTVFIGTDGNLLEEKGENCRVLEVKNPILTGVELLKIKNLDKPGFKSETISLLYYKNTSLSAAVDKLCISIDRAYNDGTNIIILSDRGVDENHMPIPSLLAVSAVEQHLIRTKKRTKVSIILESGEPRDVHQCACILGFGARAICPYLAHECIVELIDRNLLDKDYHTAIADYNSAILHGIVKTASKMGISTLQSYQSAKIFEVVGLNHEFVDKYFTGCVSRIEGIGIKEIEKDVSNNHDHAFDPLGLRTDTTLSSIGFHRLRNGKEKEEHLYNPKTIITLQRATQSGDYELFKEYSSLIEKEGPYNIRNLLEFKTVDKQLDISEVEDELSIIKRFKTGAMSYGSISKEAHECMAIAMNTLGGKSNSGEGGEDDSRFNTLKNSAIKQVASGRFGVTSHYLNNAKEIQIKMAQGAKPGEGGHLPGKKVYPWIADRRFATPGVSLISPPPHHDIYSIEDLAQLIYDLKNANRFANISVKLVSENGVGTIASGVAKAGAQVILISGYDGGTGAAPASSIHNAGLPWELGITEAHNALIKNGLRSKVRLEVDGKLMTGKDVVIAALLGGEEFGFATGPLVSMGCMMMRVCNLDTCPFGIATQNEKLRARFKGKPEYVMNYMTFVAREVREIMASLGISKFEDLIGRSDLLKQKDNLSDKLKTLNLKAVLNPESKNIHFEENDVLDFKLEETKDLKVLLPEFKKAIAKKKSLRVDIEVNSEDRTFGTILGSEITRAGYKDLEDDTFVVNAYGGGGLSFGSFIPKGLTLRLTGDSNDYIGKGLSGGKIVVVPPSDAAFDPSNNIIIGNVALYGATSGKLYVYGIAGERFCVRNSGAIGVAEGCGDHGLEYMTGGKAVILGEVGKNFAAGMSGGVAYVLDKNYSLYRKLNKNLVTMTTVSEKHDVNELKDILLDYYNETHSLKGKDILDNFNDYLPYFKKIMPNDYRKMLMLISQYEELGFSKEEAKLEAFIAANKVEE